MFALALVISTSYSLGVTTGAQAFHFPKRTLITSGRQYRLMSVGGAKSLRSKSEQPGSIPSPEGRPGWVSLISWVFGGSQISHPPHKD